MSGVLPYVVFRSPALPPGSMIVTGRLTLLNLREPDMSLDRLGTLVFAIMLALSMGAVSLLPI